MNDRLGDRLATAREQGFVGRRTQSAVFARLLTSPAGAALYVHGPGGIGKTALLHHFAYLARVAGRPAVRLDVSELRLYGEELTEHLPQCPPNRPGPVLLLDGLDTAPTAHEALRLQRTLLPRLPAGALVVWAGRDAPAARHPGPARQGPSHALPLRGLDAAEGRELLRRRGVPEDAREAALSCAPGNPLALVLAADVVAHAGAGALPGGSPHLVPDLLAALLAAAPSPRHRSALEAAAQVLTTTEPLLAALLEVADARPYFEWLRRLSVFEGGPGGIRPHDVVREALEAGVRAERRALTHRRASVYYQTLFARAQERAEQRAALADFAYLHRGSPAVGRLLEPVVHGAAVARGLDRLTVSARPAAGGELVEACTIAAIHEGSQSARLVESWSHIPGARTHTVRGPDGVAAGFYTLIELTGTPPPGAPQDPATAAVCGWLAGHGGLREGEFALLVRFWMSRDEYQALSPVQTLIAVRLAGHCLTDRRPALTLLPFADPGFWAPGCAHADFARLPEADFAAGGRRFGMFVHDWRRVPGPAWLALLTERGRAEDPFRPGAPARRQPPVLDRDAFAYAVRDALHGLVRADGLEESALLRSRLVAARCTAGAGPQERVAALRAALHAAAAALGAVPEDRPAFRALDHTFLRPAGSPARAAELLRLPMAAYRRQLAAGIGRLTELLWQEERAAEGGADGAETEDADDEAEGEAGTEGAPARAGGALSPPG